MPSFCPRPSCSQHRVVPRFVCGACRRGFSQQSFAVSYYLKRPELTVPIARGIVNSAAHRQIARVAECAPSTVTKRVARLGRHAQLLHQLCVATLPGIAEPINYDDFETFIGTQYHPSALHRQLDVLIPKASLKPLPLLSDDKKDYARAVKPHPLGSQVRHVIHPNPKRGPKGAKRSKEARERDRAMFPIDALHGFIRHSVKAHARETIAFGRRSEAQLERAYLFAVFRNLVKRRSERRPGSITPAMWIGLTDDRWT